MNCPFRYVSIARRCLLVIAVCYPLAWGQEKAAEKSDKSPPEALNSFADAASFQNNGAFDLAVEEWEKFLKQFPNDPLSTKARHYAGVCHLQLKHFEQAAAHFQAVLAKDPKFEMAEDASINLGWCQFSVGGQGKKELYAKAIETLTAHLAKFPKGKFVDQALFYIGEAHYAQGQKAEAIEAYQRLVSEQLNSPLRADGIYALGVTREESKQFAEAGTIYDQFIKEFPNNELVSEVRMRKAETLFHTGKIAEAEAIFAEVAKKAGFAAADHAVFRQADCAARQEKFDVAGQLYGKVVADFPNSAYLADAAIAAGRCFYRADKLDEAATFLKKSVDLNGKDAAEAAHWLCRVHLKKKEPQKAVELADMAIAKAGENPFVVHLKMDQADALYELAEWKDESIERYLKIVADHPQHELAPQALYNASFTALELKRFDDAAKHAAEFEKSFANDRLLPDAKYVAAECQLHRGNFAEAEKSYAQLLSQQPEHAEANVWRVRLGLSMYLQKKYAEAATALGEALPQLPSPDQQAEAHFLVGACQFEQNQSAQAIKSFEASIAAQPKWRQADETLIFLSRAQRAAGKNEEARQTVQKVIQEFPSSKMLDQAYFRLGEYQDATGDYAGAIGSYDVVLTKFPTSTMAPYAAYGKGWSKMRAKDYTGAGESFTALLSNYKDHSLAADAYFARGMSRRQAGQHPEAIGDIEAFLKTKPEANRKADALYELGLAQAAMKKYADAAKTLAGLVEENKAYPHAANVLYELAWAYKNGGQNAESSAAFSRLANEHPDSPLVAESLYHVGEEQYQQKQFAEAIKSYTAASQKAQGEVAENALHKLGWSHFRLSQYEPALSHFREQAQKFPSGALAPDAAFMQAECLFKLQKYDEAFAAFKTSIGSPSTSPQMQALAHLHGGQAAAQLGKWQESIELLDVVPQRFETSAYVAEALYERGWANQNLKKLEEAVADYEQAATKSRNEVGARARFMIGEIEFEKKEYDAAIKSFLRVMYGYGGDQATDSVKTWQGSAGFEAGRCAEVRIQSAQNPQDKAKFTQDAKTYYTFVAEKHSGHKLAGKAKERLAALAKLK